MPIPPEPPAQGMDVDNEYFVNLFQEIPEAIVLSDNVGCIAKVNREFTRLFGYSEAEAVGRFIDDLVAPEDLREEATTITEAVAHGQKFALEAVRQRKDGSLVNVSLLGVPIVTSRRQLEEANSMLERISNHDGLTAIPNRRSFEHFYELEWRRACRERKWISVVMIDVDYFKSYNDHYGHLAGDQCLKRIAQALQVLNRPGDMVARYGGEEFVAVLAGTDEREAAHMAELMRSRVTELQLPHEHSSIASHVTISLGLASEIPEAGSNALNLILKADQALYLAKSRGRNRVETVQG